MSGPDAGAMLDKSKVLKVTWEKGTGDYTSTRLGEEFEKFGPVEDVVIKSTKKKGFTLVVMSSKEAAVAATRTVCGNLSNPLLVLPLQPATLNPSVRGQEPVDPNGLPISNLVGAGYQAFEDSVLDKLRKVKLCESITGESCRRFHPCLCSKAILSDIHANYRELGMQMLGTWITH